MNKSFLVEINLYNISYSTWINKILLENERDNNYKAISSEAY